MPKPSSPAAYGIVVPALAPTSSRTHHPRFAQVRAIVGGTMPTLRVGQVWEDMDPRCAGRTLLIETITTNGTVTARTLTPRTVPARTPSGYRLDTVGSTHTIAGVRFRPGSRGFRLTGALIQLRPNGTVVNPDTITATLGEVAPRTLLPTPPAPPKPVAVITPAVITPAVITPAVITPAVAGPKPVPTLPTRAQIDSRNVRAVASLLADPATPADLRVAGTVCALLGAQNAAQWLVSREADWLIKDYHQRGSHAALPNLLLSAVQHAETLGLLDKK